MRFYRMSCFCLLLLSAGQTLAAAGLRIGLTPTFLGERPALLADWRAYLENRLGRPVAFILKDSHEETMELLRQQQIQAAWLCDCPRITMNREFNLLATPLFHGRPYYRAYLVVPQADQVTHRLLDLKDKVFAYGDPFSNAGYMNPRYELWKFGIDPDHFFRRTFLTHTHGNAIEAVAAGVADATSVNSYVWETLDQQPALTGRTRIAARSVEYGFPPFVTTHTMAPGDFRALQRALLTMAENARGRAVLKKMNLDGFALPQPELYQPVREIVRYVENR